MLKTFCVFSVKLGDLQAASDSFDKSLELAKKLGDRAAEDAISKAQQEVNNKIVKGVKEGEDRDEDDQGSGKEEDGRESPVSGRALIGEFDDFTAHCISFEFHLLYSFEFLVPIFIIISILRPVQSPVKILLSYKLYFVSSNSSMFMLQ